MIVYYIQDMIYGRYYHGNSTDARKIKDAKLFRTKFQAVMTQYHRLSPQTHRIVKAKLTLI